MKRWFFTICLMAISAPLLQAQIDNTQTITKTGTTAAQFLKIGTDARATAMGGAFTAITGDLASMHWNPAGLSYITGIEATFLHSPWLAEMDFNYFAFAFEIPGMGVMGASITSLTSPDDLVRTVQQPEGTGELFSASDLAISLSFARQLTDHFAIGGSVRYVRQNIWHSSANGIAADIGALFITPFRGIRLGASIINYGSNMRMDGRDLRFSYDPDPDNQGNVEFVNALLETESFPMPLVFRVGISGELYKTESVRLSFGLDALHPNDNSESINGGAELAFNETFFLRAGYTTLFRADTEEGLTVGGGIHYRLWGSSTLLKLDYSYASFGLLNSVQRFSLGIKF
ncbi:MAG: PorV/PorQ family protein [candidate division KSB1 bacterium]|nr:PorV/PorQ family protein [candidate division KSB1 bacterium]MDQ7064240.1 PorV/PorQ family protein [candidate division KSB1 bacterium]